MEKIFYTNDDVVDKISIKSRLHKVDLWAVYKFTFLLACDLWELGMETKLQRNDWVASIKKIYNEFNNMNMLEIEGLQLIIKDSNCLMFKEKYFRKNENYIEGVYDAFENLIKQLSEHEWDEVEYNLIPRKQKEQRNNINNTSENIEIKCLHEDFFLNANKYPDKIALIYKSNERIEEITYSELKKEVLKSAENLINHGVKEKDKVAVFLPKGYEQIIAVLSVLSIGAIYVPININQPKERIKKIINGNIKHIFINRLYSKKAKFSEINIILIEERVNYNGLSTYVQCNLENPAYIIFTSGSSGEPKGVIISHKSAYNTIYDVNQRFGVTDRDRIISISELDFDLSVYDIFGLLSSGGSILIVNEDLKKEPMNWLADIVKFNVTMWNSVPALFEMLLNINDNENRNLPFDKIFLSGDWIKPNLARRILSACKNCKLIAMGGATEASIWSIYFEVFEVGESCKFIPYGIPLANQKMRIVNSYGYDCPDNIIGELWIGGIGVADGYLNSPELTQSHFMEIDGERWYRTGDLARYDSEGIIEFIGRKDTQVKINGYRIELGEIEKVIKKYEGISEAIAIVNDDKASSKITVAVIPELKAYVRDNNIIIDISDVDPNEFSQYEEEIEKFLVNLCGLDNLVIGKFLQNLSVVNSKVLKQWLSWLQFRNIIDLNEGKIIRGKRYSDALQKSKTRSKIINDLYAHIDLLKAILQGSKEKNEIFNYEVLTPEYLTLQDMETRLCIDNIIKIIKEESNKRNSDFKVGVLGARTGMALDVISRSLDINVSFTAMESSWGMIKNLKERLNKSKVIYECKKIDYDYFVMDELYKYDFIIAVGALHFYENPNELLNIISMLLKDDGRLLAVEYIKLSPIALVVSGIIEDGFIRYSGKREYINSPLISGEEWRKYFSMTDFSEVAISNVNRKSTIFINAPISNNRRKINKRKLIEYAENKLPKYMVPDKITFLSKAPLTENGKVDRKQIKNYINYTSDENVVKECECVGFEAEIAKMWMRLLEVSHINRNDNFFVIGGDSIIATRFIAQIKREYSVDLTLRQILDTPKLEDITKIINTKIGEIGNIVEGEI